MIKFYCVIVLSLQPAYFLSRPIQTPNCDTMKVAVVFVLLFATVLCRPARKFSASSSESSEEVVRRPAQAIRNKEAVVPQSHAAPVQNIVAPAAAGSDESKESSDEDQATTEATAEVKSDSIDTTSSSSDTASVSKDSEDSDDDDDDDEAEESETEEDDSSDSSESGEASTPVPATLTPVVVTEGPVAETTVEPIVPTIVTDTDTGRGDSLGGYPSDYKSIVYVEDKSYHKVPAPYKSYEFVGTGKKMAYDMTDGNEVEKSLHVYKALQVHSDLLEEDTSTPEVESQGLDTSSGTSQDQDISHRQASVSEDEESASASTSTTSESESESSSTPEEEEEEESASTPSESDSASASQESEDEESQSSEEATATPGAADSDSDESDESDSDEEGAGPDATTDMPVVITAK